MLLVRSEPGPTESSRSHPLSETQHSVIFQPILIFCSITPYFYLFGGQGSAAPHRYNCSGDLSGAPGTGDKQDLNQLCTTWCLMRTNIQTMPPSPLRNGSFSRSAFNYAFWLLDF